MMATTVSSEQSEAPTLRRTVYDTIIALSDPISNDVLQSKLHLLDVQSWHEVVEERYLGRLCGFPTCSKKVHVELKQKYKINRQSKKVYDSSAEELKFCSKECLAKHQYVLTLVESQPLWLTGDRPPMTSSFEWLQDPGLETLKEKKKEVDSEADVITASLISRITSLKIADNEDDADSSGDEEREKEEGEEKESSGPLFQDQSSKIVIDDSTLEGTKSTAPSSQAENALTPPRLSARKLSESSGGKSENPEEKLARLKAKYPVDKTRAAKTAHALVSLIEAKPAPRAAAATTLPTKSLNCSNFERVLHEWLSPAALRYLKNGHVEEEEVYGSEDDPPDIRDKYSPF
uniref:RNA polymerase II subunit B1 CTD phosphatase RPAP2 homolog n=1 Tax=Plectus sambesii TaxID=2011161 RepID=A0A914VLM8_9BILA